MIYNPPFYGFNRRYYNPHININYKKSNYNYDNSHKSFTSCDSTIQDSPLSTSYNNIEKNDDVLFEIFGIKLYFDDVLLICLIFFLYNEGVQDQYLFISLLLLLVS